MSNIKVTILLNKRQILNDASVHTGILGKILQRNKETEEQGADLMNLESTSNKPIVARAMADAFGQLKELAAPYLAYGKYTADNRLESMDNVLHFAESLQLGEIGTYDLVAGIRHVIRIKSQGGVCLTTTTGKMLGIFDKEGEVSYTPSTTCRLMVSDQAAVVYCKPVYGVYELILAMPPSYNLGATESLKSAAHRFVVNSILRALLQLHFPEKAAIYAVEADNNTESIRSALRARIKYSRSAADWA